MGKEKRSHEGYEIIEGCTIGRIEIVIGHHRTAPNPYVCWYCKGGDYYYWGYYCNSMEKAREKLNERCHVRSRMTYDNHHATKQKNGDGRGR